MLTPSGWQIFAHPLFLDQLERLVRTVEEERTKNPDGFQGTPDAKVLAALRDLVFVKIPADPTRPEYRQGSTIGADRRHWFRAKFGNQRFRLFFRFSSKAKVIVFAWVNDRDSLRTYGTKSDAYAVFRGMLDKGHSPDDWTALLHAAQTTDDRFARL
jgi:toxin YhaV